MEIEKIIDLSPDEIEKIKQFKQNYVQFVYRLGELDVELVELAQRIKEDEEERSKIFDSMKSMRSEEDKFKNTLPEKYGDGILDYENFKYKIIKKEN